MSGNWPDKREKEIVFRMEAVGCAKTPKEESEEPSEAAVLGVRAREVQSEAGGCRGREGWLSLGGQPSDFLQTSSDYHSS